MQLGYGYGWYVRGPYSTSLARDYYAMALELSIGEVAEGSLADSVKTRLAPLAAIVIPPTDAVSLDRPDWLELLASVHFLRKVRGLSDGGVASVLAKEKPSLATFRPIASEQLEQAGLLP